MAIKNNNLISTTETNLIQLSDNVKQSEVEDGAKKNFLSKIFKRGNLNFLSFGFFENSFVLIFDFSVA